MNLEISSTTTYCLCCLWVCVWFVILVALLWSTKLFVVLRASGMCNVRSLKTLTIKQANTVILRLYEYPSVHFGLDYYSVERIVAQTLSKGLELGEELRHREAELGFSEQN